MAFALHQAEFFQESGCGGIIVGFESIAKFIHKFVQYKELKDITLLGNSLGGHVALVYILSHPEKVKSLVLTGSSGLYENAFGGTFPRRGSYDFVKEKVEYTFYDPNNSIIFLINHLIFQSITHLIEDMIISFSRLLKY